MPTKKQRRQDKREKKDTYLANLYNQKQEESIIRQEAQSQLNELRKQEQIRIEEGKKQEKLKSIPSTVLFKWSYKKNSLSGSLWDPVKKVYENHDLEIVNYCPLTHSVLVTNKKDRLYLLAENQDSFYKKRDFFSLMERECVCSKM
jgi:hypothetical protein